MYVATVSLSGCGGCENALLAAGEPLVSLLSEHTISFSALLHDRWSVTPSDVVLASGCVRNSEEEEIASEIARTSRKVIAVGTCAVYGGICGIRRLAEPAPPEESGLPRIYESPQPLDSFMTVELYVPGCPPPSNLILEALKSLLEGYAPLRFDSTVCADCSRRVERKAVKSLQAHPGAGAEPGVCLLSSGLLCMGPVTRAGCRAACPSVGVACSGCRGPSDAVLSSQLHSVFADLAAQMARTCKSRPETAAARLEEHLEILSLFTRRDPVTRARAREKVPRD